MRQLSPSAIIRAFQHSSRYPPSLQFLLMSLGPSMLALRWFERSPVAATGSLVDKLRNVFVTFGRVPLFFYILQWYTAHLISVCPHYVAGKPVRWMFDSQALLTGAPPGVGFSLWVVYLSWIAGVMLLYPLCKWFAGIKARRHDWWLSYL